jgi:hypothetical protein
LKRKENALRLSLDYLSAQKSVGPTQSAKINENNMLDCRFSVAPMMDWTDERKKRGIVSIYAQSSSIMLDQMLYRPNVEPPVANDVGYLVVHHSDFDSLEEAG